MRRICSCLFLFFGILILLICRQIQGYSFDQLVFHIMTPLVGTDTGVIWTTILKCLPLPIIVTAVFFILTVYPRRHNLYVYVRVKKKEKKWIVMPIPLIMKHMILVTVGALCVCLIGGAFYLRIPDYMSRQINSSTIYEENYIDPFSQDFIFPDKKRNLIFLYLESMESTFMSKEEGGQWEYNLIPQLTELSKENISFGETKPNGGIHEVSGAGWTMGALVSYHSGIPLSLPIEGNSYGTYESFLPGAETLGDILHKEGYRQMFLLGSEVAFGGRDKFFSQHGEYEIWDYNTALETQSIPEGYHVFWGYEDQKLYQFAQQRLLEFATDERPFSLTMLSVDTHFYDGYVCELCENTYDTQYENVIACADRQAASFIRWLQQQDFYKDTTVVIVGDHFSMDGDFFADKKIDYQDRRIYNCIVNAPQDVQSYGALRTATSLDYFPTVMTALGVQWGQDRLGLGTNLFSDTPTLTEVLGMEDLNYQLGSNSNYYNKNILYP